VARREIEILRVERTVLSRTLLDLRYLGEPSTDFPYPFVGYPSAPEVPFAALVASAGRRSGSSFFAAANA